VDQPLIDFTAVNHGSIVMLHTHTCEAEVWAREHLPEDALRYGRAVVIEPRYIADIVAGIRGDGMLINFIDRAFR
jgi:hypothetical protein